MNRIMIAMCICIALLISGFQCNTTEPILMPTLKDGHSVDNIESIEVKIKPKMHVQVYLVTSEENYHSLSRPSHIRNTVTEVQYAYAAEMARHGFGAKTFSFDKNVNGDVNIEHIEPPEWTSNAHNLTRREIIDLLTSEQHQHVDNVTKAYFVDLESLDGSPAGVASLNGLFCVMFALEHNRRFPTNLFFHELMHTFGERHGWEDTDFEHYRFGINLFHTFTYDVATRLNQHPAFNHWMTEVMPLP